MKKYLLIHEAKKVGILGRNCSVLKLLKVQWDRLDCGNVDLIASSGLSLGCFFNGLKSLSSKGRTKAEAFFYLSSCRWKKRNRYLMIPIMPSILVLVKGSKQTVSNTLLDELVTKFANAKP